MASGALAIHAIWSEPGTSPRLIRKHAIKQVERLLCNRGVDMWTYFAYWVPFVLRERKAIVVALDWTDFSADGLATIALH